MGITDITCKHKRIMLDTAPIIYFIEENKTYSHIMDGLFHDSISRSDCHLFSSVITLLEVLTQPFRNNRPDIIKKYREFLMNSMDFTLYSIDSVIAEKSAEIRAKYNLRTPDAIQLAIALENNATLFITNDNNLEKIKEIKILILKDFI